MIIDDPTTISLREPYCVLWLDDADERGQRGVSTMVHRFLNSSDDGEMTLTRSYRPGHADSRWPPTVLAITPGEVRLAFNVRPAQKVAVPVSLVQQMYKGWNLALVYPRPE